MQDDRVTFALPASVEAISLRVAAAILCNEIVPTRSTPTSMYALPAEAGSAAISFSAPLALAAWANALNALTRSSSFSTAGAACVTSTHERGRPSEKPPVGTV